MVHILIIVKWVWLFTYIFHEKFKHSYVQPEKSKCRPVDLENQCYNLANNRHQLFGTQSNLVLLGVCLA